MSEVEPNDYPNSANSVVMGATVTGNISRQGDEDWYVLKYMGYYSTPITIDIDAQSIGSDLNSLIEVYEKKDNILRPILANDDSAAFSESELAFNALNVDLYKILNQTLQQRSMMFRASSLDSRLTFMPMENEQEFYIVVKGGFVNNGTNGAYKMTIYEGHSHNMLSAFLTLPNGNREALYLDDFGRYGIIDTENNFITRYPVGNYIFSVVFPDDKTKEFSFNSDVSFPDYPIIRKPSFGEIDVPVPVGIAWDAISGVDNYEIGIHSADSNVFTTFHQIYGQDVLSASVLLKPYTNYNLELFGVKHAPQTDPDGHLAIMSRSGSVFKTGAFIMPTPTQPVVYSTPTSTATRPPINTPIPTATIPVASLEGSVLDAISKSPIANTQLILENIGSTTSDSSGKYRFIGVPYGVYRIACAASGYLSYIQKVLVDKNTVNFEILLKPIIIPTMTATPTIPTTPTDTPAHFLGIYGVVTDSLTGNSIENANVVLSSGALVLPVTATTDFNGFYEFYKLRPDVYQIKITKDNYYEYSTNLTLRDADIEHNVALMPTQLPSPTITSTFTASPTSTRKPTATPTNVPPSIESVVIKPDPGYEGTTLEAYVKGWKDPDSAKRIIAYRWFVNGSEVADLNDFRLPTSYTHSGDAIEVEALPSDGISNGIPVRSTQVFILPRPQPPTNLTSKSDDRTVELTWEPLATAFGYNIYRSQSLTSAFVMINDKPIVAPTYTDKNLINGLTYWYKAASLDNFGCESAQSEPVSATPSVQIQQDFSVSVARNLKTLMIEQGASNKLPVQVSSLFGYNKQVMLFVSGIPQNVTAAFNPLNLLPSNVSLLEISPALNAEPGKYNITVGAVDAESRQRTDTFELTIIQKLISQSVITCHVEPRVTTTDKAITVFGMIKPKVSADVYVKFTRDNQYVETKSVLSDGYGKFSATYLADKEGDWQCYAYWLGNESIEGATSETATYKVKRAPSKLAIDTDYTENNQNAMRPKDFSRDVTIKGKLSVTSDCNAIYIDIFSPYNQNSVTSSCVLFSGLQAQSYNPDYVALMDENGEYTINIVVDATGEWKVIASWGGDENYVGTVSNPLIIPVGVDIGKAVVVSGTADSPIGLSVLRTITDFVYDALNVQRYNNESIHYLASNGSQKPVDGGSSLTSLQATFNSLSDLSAPLFVYIIGEMDNGSLVLSDGNKLTPSGLNSLLSSVNKATEVIVLVEADAAGDFATGLAGNNRIIITSTNTEKATLAGGGLISFSSFFFAKAREGASVGKCYYHALDQLQGMGAMFSVPSPRISSSGIDPDTAYIGASAGLTDRIPPVVQAVEAPETILLGGKSKIKAKINDDTGVQAAVIDITPASSEESITVPMNYIGSGSWYETPNINFSVAGIYQLAVIARDTSGNLAELSTKSVSVEPGSHLGDLNSDGAIDAKDLLLFVEYWTTTPATKANFLDLADIDNNGIVNQTDLFAIISLWHANLNQQ